MPYAATIAKIPFAIPSKIAIAVLFLLIVSPNLLKTFPRFFKTFIITPPVHFAIGNKKFSNNHLPAFINAFTIGFKTFIAPATKSKKAGSKSSIVHFASGTKIFL